MANSWSADAAKYLTNWARCPRCDRGVLIDGWCPSCNTDMTGPEAVGLAAVSTEAADAIRRRQLLIDALPVKARESSTATAAVSPAAIASPTAVASPSIAATQTEGSYTASQPAAATVVPPFATPAAAGPSSQISVQSILAVAGAGLLAIAALVFTFLNPDLTDVTLRTVIIGVTTAVFLGGAWLLARAGLQFSAEAVGALGMVFVALDIWALTLASPEALSDWVFAGIGTVVASVIMILVAARARIRSWAWSGLVGLAISPAFFGAALYSTVTEGIWWAMAFQVLAGFMALALHFALPPLEKRIGSGLRVERATLTVIQVVAAGIVVIELLFQWADKPLLTAAALASLAALAALSARTLLPRFWSYGAGVLAAAAVAVVPFVIPLANGTWQVALVPAGAAIALVAIAAVRSHLHGMDRTFSLGGAWTVALIAGIPAVALGVAQLVCPVLQLTAGDLNPANYPFGSSYAEFPIQDHTVGDTAFISPTAGLAATLGLAALTAGSIALWRLARLPRPVAIAASADGPARARLGLARGALLLAAWSGAGVLLTLTGWSALVRPAQSAIGLVLAVLISAALVRLPRLSRVSLRFRLPVILAAHGLVLLVGLISWADSRITVIVGAAMAVAFAAVAQTVPRALRPLHFAVGYAYGLIIFATALDQAGVVDIAVLCLTTSLASLFALAVTLTGWLRPATWYATLIVTIVPFLCAIAAVLGERSGWTALSTALTFGLALAVLITRRSGLTSFLRIAAAALLVPSLAVVVVCLGAQFLVTSGAPATLPVIAVIVAAVLPSTGLIRAALVKRGLTDADALATRDWIEYSSFLTAALAVLLALARPAAGFGTSFLVLFILGLGSLAAAYFARRRYAWWAAAASFTGALWSVWAIVGIDVIEPYLLPPALSAVIVGAALTARGRTAVGLFTSGLASATIPSVAILAIGGSGSATVAWRAYGLLAGAAVLVAVGAWLGRVSATGRAGRLRALQHPILLVAVFTTAAAAIQAVRYGQGFDPLSLVDDQLVMLVVLAFSIGAFLLSSVAAWLLLQRSIATRTDSEAPATSRWYFAAPLVYLAIGPIAGIRPGAFPIATLWVLMAVLLATMIVTVARARTRDVALPPVWFLFGLAWCAAVSGWSERDLRVEVFSLPLGLALLAAGVIALRASATANAVKIPGWTSWPLGFTGSWRLLTPGILVIFVTSVLSTGTDPQTWRAILVIALALIAIFVGSLLKLAAPFILGIVVLPIENLVVFAVQIGKNIGAGPWWITLSTAGAVLLVLAVTSERRTGAGGVASRIRDLT